MLQLALGAGVVSLKKCQSAKRNMKRVKQEYGLHDMYEAPLRRGGVGRSGRWAGKHTGPTPLRSDPYV